MKRLVFLFTLLWGIDSAAKDILKVAVIDTGLKMLYRPSAHLCKMGHKDLTGEGIHDYKGHGTNITGLIVNNADSDKYCIVIIKAYAKGKGFDITRALQYAYDIGVDIINLSGGGEGFRSDENQIVKKLLDRGTVLIFASGNNRTNLDKNCNYYPACYDPRIFVIGSSTTPSSNYGKKTVDVEYDGQDQTAFGETFSGSSQATAIFTGKLVNDITHKANK